MNRRMSASAGDSRAEARKFIEAFGESDGAKWFALGKTFAEAQALQVAGLREQLAARDKEVESLKLKLSTVPPQGEQKPLTFQAENEKPAAGKTNRMPASLAKVAGAIVLPQTAAAARN